MWWYACKIWFEISITKFRPIRWISNDLHFDLVYFMSQHSIFISILLIVSMFDLRENSLKVWEARIIMQTNQIYTNIHYTRLRTGSVIENVSQIQNPMSIMLFMNCVAYYKSSQKYSIRTNFHPMFISMFQQIQN